MNGGVSLGRIGGRPRPPRRLPFVLTPLIDVMFLLLIFFMLSSQIAPYSLISVGGVAEEHGAAAETPAAPLHDIAIRVLAGSVELGGETLPTAELHDRLRQLVDAGATGAMVIAGRSATVQDIVDVLEMLQASRLDTVTLVNSRGLGS